MVLPSLYREHSWQRKRSLSYTQEINFLTAKSPPSPVQVDPSPPLHQIALSVIFHAMSVTPKDIVQPLLLDLVSSFYMVDPPSLEMGLCLSTQHVQHHVAYAVTKGSQGIHWDRWAFFLLCYFETDPKVLWLQSLQQQCIPEGEPLSLKAKSIVMKLLQEGRSPWGQRDPSGSKAAFLETELARTVPFAIFSLPQRSWMTWRVEDQRNNLFNEKHEKSSPQGLEKP